MKTKRLFSLAMLGLAVSASAQYFPGNESASVVKQEKAAVIRLNPKTISSKMTSSDEVQTRANGVSYLRPEGTFWIGFNKKGEGYRQSILHVPAWKALTFENTSESPSTTVWTINNEPADDFVVDNDFVTAYPTGEQVGSTFPLPTLSSGGNSFILGSSNEDGSFVMTNADTETVLSTTEPGLFALENGGSNEEKTYFYGSDVTEKGATMSKAIMFYEKPSAPLCVTNIFYPIYSRSGAPLPEGTKMTLKVLNVVMAESGGKIPGEEVFFEFTAGSEDIKEMIQFQSGEVLRSLSFSNKVYNPITETMDDEIFVIDQEFCFELSGFDQANVDLGLSAMETTNEEPTNSFMVFPNEPDKFYRYGELNFPVFITGFFNVIDILGPTVFVAPNAGGAAVDQDEEKYNAVSVFTTLPWSDENFWFEEEIPEWLEVKMSEQELERQGCYLLLFTAQPLEGDGRDCRLTLKSFGSTANEPIYILQGNGSGISTTEANEVNAVRNGNNFELTYGNDVTSVEVMNAAGQLVANYNLNGTSFVMPAANLANGLYILKFNGEKATTVKIVK